MSQHTSRSIENLLIHPLNRGFDFFVKKKQQPFGADAPRLRRLKRMLSKVLSTIIQLYPSPVPVTMQNFQIVENNNNNLRPTSLLPTCQRSKK